MYDLNVEIGRRIAKLRNANKMTQETLAEKLDCSVKHISHVERGVSSLSLEKLIDISELFGCFIDYLIKGEGITDVSALMPQSLLVTLKERGTDEIDLFTEYLNMYEKIRTTK